MEDKTRAARELSVLYKVSKALVHRQAVSGLLQDVLDILETEIGLSRGALTLRQPDSDVFVIEASRGLTTEECQRGQYKLGEGVTGTVAQTAKSEVVPDISKDPRFLNRTRARTGQNNAFICVPIIHHGQVIGTMSIDRPSCDDLALAADRDFLLLLAGLLIGDQYRCSK